MKKNTKKLTWANASFRHPCCGGFGDNPKDAPHKPDCSAVFRRKAWKALGRLRTFKKAVRK
jgi:hypothetical protein